LSSDDELRESIESNQLKKMDERYRPHHLQPARSFMRTIGDFETGGVGRDLQQLCHRVARLFPERFVGAAMLPQSPGSIRRAASRSSNDASTSTACRHQPEPGSFGRPLTSPPSPTGTGIRSTRRWSSSRSRP
jgi:hypothetical protein